MWSSRSQCRVDDVVDLRAQSDWVDGGEPATPLDELFARQPGWLQRAQLGDGSAGTCHREVLAPLDPVDNGTTVVSQLSNRHLSHRSPVYHA